MKSTPTALTRREFLNRTGTAAAGLLAAGLAWGDPAFGDEPAQRPNIVFILTDDQRYDALGFMGRPSFLKTPNLDRLAREGAHVRNAFVTIALCAPSRACFMTGCYAHKHGVVNNEGYDPDPLCPNVGQLLQKAGYETAYIGKWHQAPKSDPRPGFDYWLSFLGQGTYQNPELNENGRQFKAQGYMTDILTDYAIKFVQTKRDKPFCMVLSHKAVHEPFTPADRHKDAFANESLPEPPSYKDTFAGKPAWMRRAFTYGTGRDTWPASEGKPIPDKIERKPWDGKKGLGYYRALLGVDDSVGKVMEALEKAGQLDNTFIIFAGDNGYFLGEHGLNTKRIGYEPSIRIPVVVRYPKLVKAGSKVDGTALNIDFAPTFLELAGAEAPQGMQGRSMLSVLRGRPGRESFLFEYFREENLPGMPLLLGVRTDRWKLCTYPDMNDIDELYDLKNDPDEMHNLSQDPTYGDILKKMRDELARLKKETEYPEVHPGRPPVRKTERVLGPVLTLDFSKGNADDLSGQKNNGTLHGGQFVDDGGRKVLKLAKGDFIDISKSDTLSPGQIDWTVEVMAKPESADGVILAHGGPLCGYALYLKDRVPHLAIRINRKLTDVAARYPIADGWTRFTINIKEKDAQLWIDRKLVASNVKVGRLPENPLQGMQIGTDQSSHVGDYEDPDGFAGLFESVRAWAGQVSK